MKKYFFTTLLLFFLCFDLIAQSTAQITVPEKDSLSFNIKRGLTIKEIIYTARQKYIERKITDKEYYKITHTLETKFDSIWYSLKGEEFKIMKYYQLKLIDSIIDNPNSRKNKLKK